MSQLNARLLVPVYIWLKNKYGGIGRPEFRLRKCLLLYFAVALVSLILCSDDDMILLPIGLLLTG
jgi:hypothetical protein